MRVSKNIGLIVDIIFIVAISGLILFIEGCSFYDKNTYEVEIWMTRPDGEIEHYSGLSSDISYDQCNDYKIIHIGDLIFNVANENVFVKRRKITSFS
jgi:hypothetical protein